MKKHKNNSSKRTPAAPDTRCYKKQCQEQCNFALPSIALERRPHEIHAQALLRWHHVTHAVVYTFVTLILTLHWHCKVLLCLLLYHYYFFVFCYDMWWITIFQNELSIFYIFGNYNVRSSAFSAAHHWVNSLLSRKIEVDIYRRSIKLWLVIWYDTFRRDRKGN